MRAAGTPAAGSFSVSADHPCLPGHFLGGSIVPGVVLLDEAFALILAANPGRIVVGLPSVKFVRPVLPAQLVTLSWREAAERHIAFTCAVAAQTVLHGSVLLGPPFGLGVGSHAVDQLPPGPVPSGQAG
jgi:3-hydroxyacyl-[acyl-carrier-protein] dehydratase